MTVRQQLIGIRQRHSDAGQTTSEKDRVFKVFLRRMPAQPNRYSV